MTIGKPLPGSPGRGFFLAVLWLAAVTLAFAVETFVPTPSQLYPDLRSGAAHRPL